MVSSVTWCQTAPTILISTKLRVLELCNVTTPSQHAICIDYQKTRLHLVHLECSKCSSLMEVLKYAVWHVQCYINTRIKQIILYIILSAALKCHRVQNVHVVRPTLVLDRNSEQCNKYFVVSKKYFWGNRIVPFQTTEQLYLTKFKLYIHAQF